MSLYQSKRERMADVIAANASPHIVWRKVADGGLKLESTTPIERQQLAEKAAEASARLAGDAALRK